ncbi:MAG: glycosyltransferase family 4 protein [Acidobacteriota bacterium]|jgi:glycosyltransferase involved in cell wall biosynthesis
MRIAYISAGAAGMYCGSCMHDNTLARGLIDRGHEVALMPTYTPMRTEDRDVSMHRVFYGALSVYLEQKSGLFRHMPRFLDRLMNQPWLLNLVSRLGSSVDPEDLGDLTLSVLEGEDGRQRRELDELVAWLRDDYRPDVVHLTNSMMLGMAGPIRRELGVPVICSLQGEDLFLDELREPFRSRVLETLHRKARDADGFIATSEYYADHMSGMLEVPRDRVHVVHLGIRLDDHLEAPSRPTAEPFTIGYLSRICPEKGLHHLADAFRLLAEQVGPEHVRLRAAGYLGARDRRYLDSIRSRVRGWGLGDRFEYLGEVDRAGKLAFLQSLDVFSVPSVYRESKGIPALEAMASAVPVVQPAHGAYPEILEHTGGGVLVEPGRAEALASALRALRDDPVRRRQLGLAGREAVRARFNERVMAEATLEVFGAARRAVA